MNFNNIQSQISTAASRYSLTLGLNLLILAALIFIFPKVLAYTLAALIGLGGFALIYFSFKNKNRSKKQANTQYQETVYVEV